MLLKIVPFTWLTPRVGVGFRQRSSASSATGVSMNTLGLRARRDEAWSDGTRRGPKRDWSDCIVDNEKETD